MRATQADESDALEREAELAHRLTRRLPLGFFSLGVLAAVLISHVLIKPFIAEEDRWQVIAIDVAVISLCTLLGWVARVSYGDSTRGRALESWEAPFGTGGIALACASLSAGLCYWSFRYDWTWMGIGASCLVACIYAVSPPTRVMLEPGDVILSGEQPEHLDDFIRRDYEVAAPRESAEQGTVKVGLWVNKETLKTFRSINPETNWAGTGRPGFEWYVERGRCAEVNALADELSRVSRSRGLSRGGEVRLVLDLVQALPYRTDSESTGKDDYWRFPIETIADGEGDCEDTSILAVALLSAMGHHSCFFDMPGHVAIGVDELPDDGGVRITVAEGRHFAFVETTSKPFLIGELPPDVREDDVKVGALVPPLKGRNKANDLVAVDARAWASDSRTLVTGTLVLMAGGALLAILLSWAS